MSSDVELLLDCAAIHLVQILLTMCILACKPCQDGIPTGLCWGPASKCAYGMVERCRMLLQHPVLGTAGKVYWPNVSRMQHTAACACNSSKVY